MSEDLLSQLAEYGRDHRAEQRPVDVDDLGRGPVVDDPDAGSTATVIELRPVDNRGSTLMSKKMFVGGLVAAAAVVAILGFAVASGTATRGR